MTRPVVPYGWKDKNGKHVLYRPDGTLMSDTECQLWLDYLKRERDMQPNPEWIVGCIIIGGFALYGLYCLFHYWG